ncbi:MAG: hypothetical protein II096_04270, partial [Erysipelotrichaceae bacterium]|nr:hypothetical protein [Erysipelotrichaceae bacterium]
LFIVPYIVSQMIGMSGDVFANLLSVLPYEGVVLVCTGAYLSSKATSVVPRTHDRDLIRFLLADDNLSRKFKETGKGRKLRRGRKCHLQSFHAASFAGRLASFLPQNQQRCLPGSRQ